MHNMMSDEGMYLHGMHDGMGFSLLPLIFLVIFSIVYLIPTILALFMNKKTLLHIIIMNIFVGFTFIGWILALIMVFLDDTRYVNKS